MHKNATLFLVCAALAAGPALAEKPTWFGDGPAQGKWMIGAKTGNMINEGTDYGDATNNGLVLGYTFARPVAGNGSASIEFEATSTADDGSFGPDSDQGAPGVWSVSSKAVYFAYRTGGTVYFKGKLGGVIADIKRVRDSGATPNDTVEESGASLGAGVGMRLGERANLELEWASGIGINDINYVSLGAAINF